MGHLALMVDLRAPLRPSNASGSTTERTYDGTGQPGSVTYIYDLRGRLVEVASQTYDPAAGRRVR